MNRRHGDDHDHKLHRPKRGVAFQPRQAARRRLTAPTQHHQQHADLRDAAEHVLMPRRPVANRPPLPQELSHDDRQHDKQDQPDDDVPKSTSARTPISSHSHAGTTIKHARLVIIVTRNATASLPPARRVQTAAVASVHGTVVARITPAASSGGSTRLASQPSGGATPLLITDASHAGPGRRTASPQHAAFPAAAP